MQTIALPEIGTWEAWRDAARGLMMRGVPPDEVLWQWGEDGGDLFGGESALPSARIPPKGPPPMVPKAFVSTARLAIWHRDPERFARAYALLWRLQREKHLMSDRADPAVAQLEAMAKNVSRDAHKMKAFVRFREIGQPDAARRSFAAWFEPTFHALEPTAPFFTRRFADMDWRIVTPDKTAIFEDGALHFGPGQTKPPLPEDAAEGLWTTYFRNIFNPARVKIGAMTSEMPRKYWKNMPETRAIPAMLAEAESRVRKMAEAAPTLPPAFATPAARQQAAHDSAWQMPKEGLEAAIRGCTRCPLHGMATQAVPGEGALNARLMIVGEQPGDREDLEGRPFVGPAGQVLDHAMAKAGLTRDDVYLTNAVKHFRFRPMGKRRLHQSPERDHIEHCRWWLDLEETRHDPQLIVAMGATALQALTGTGKDLIKRRGGLETSRLGHPVLVTVHPAYLLRIKDLSHRADATAQFHADLAKAQNHVETKVARQSPEIHRT
ncbi:MULTISPECIES: UdgX family uracil-DNA binding protein [unclassified Marinovum]